MNNNVQAEEVANYLNKNRAFFHIFPDLLNELSIPHPKTGKEISLLEKQIINLRAQKNKLQIEVDALRNIAGKNGELLHRIYLFSNLLLASKNEQEAIDIIYKAMRELFAVEHIAMVSWDVPNSNIKGITQLGLSQGWVVALKSTLRVHKPACGLLDNDWQKGLFHTEKKIASVCLLPLGSQNLGNKKIWGVLALGATSNRFSPELGTYFLKIIGNMITARLQRLFE
jgi:uncharacterized protein YigA (DUF484 family)